MKLAKEWNESGLQNEAVYTIGVHEGVGTGVLSKNGGVADFQARLQGLYGQLEEPDKERNFMILAKAWNKSVSTLDVAKPRLQNNEVYRVDMSVSLVDDGVSSQSEASNLRVK